jgi:hypothetical protein
MIRWEIIILLALVMLDIILTYLALYQVKNKFKIKKWYAFEGNNVVSYFFKKYGLHTGARISALFSLLLITGVIFYLNWRVPANDFSSIIFFAMGIYTILNVSHIMNLKKLSEGQLVGVKKK